MKVKKNEKEPLLNEEIENAYQKLVDKKQDKGKKQKVDKKKKQEKNKKNKTQVNENKKVKDTKSAPLSIKDFLRMLIDKATAKKRGANMKMDAPFHFVCIKCLKGNAQKVAAVLNDKGVIFQIASQAQIVETFTDECLGKGDIDIIFAIVQVGNEEKKQNSFEAICSQLKEDAVVFSAYAIKPSSADLNLIYLLTSKGV